MASPQTNQEAKQLKLPVLEGPSQVFVAPGLVLTKSGTPEHMDTSVIQKSPMRSIT